MSNPPNQGSGLTALGKLFSFLLVVGLLALGGWVVMNRMNAKPDDKGTGTKGADGKPAVAFDPKEMAETQTEVPKLGVAGTYEPKDNIVDLELSEYAGYAGLIAANGGLEPNDNSFFATKHGFKVRIKLSEEESWPALNAGKMAASATTVDVLAVYGRQFQVVVPAQIGYSRGADGLVVRNDIKKVNDLKGKVVVASQFTEADFFIRYLATEAGLPINMLSEWKDAPNADAVNLVYSEDGFTAGDVFLAALKGANNPFAACVTWAPKTSEIPAESDGKAKLLVTNKNLLLIADILIVNRGFAEKNPKMVAGLVEGLLAGNKMVRDNPTGNADVIGKAFKWDRQKTLAELQKVHLSNLPEQMAFFNSGIKQGGSFASIFQSAIQAYGPALIPNPVDSDRFLALDALKSVETAGTYKDATAAIVPLSANPGLTSESDPVLSKDIRFQFEINSSNLDMKTQSNLKNLDAIKQILDISPGSRILVVGHVDPLGQNDIRERARRAGADPEAAVRQAGLAAKQLSKDRAAEIVSQFKSKHTGFDAKRFEIVGMGWDRPASPTDSDVNRRVEVQWFTLE